MEYKQELTPEDYKAFSRLKDHGDFKRLRAAVDGFQLQRAYNLISATEAEKGAAEEELKSYRGGYLLWKKVADLVDNAEENLNDLETNQKDNG